MLGVFDHLAIAARSLDETGAVEEALGVPLEAGGKHAAMGTHNRLLSLGSGAYLEVIAVDPEAPSPGRPRWFALDGFDGPPAPRAWIARCGDLRAAMAAAPEGIGEAMDFQRDALRWQMAVPGDGLLPYGGVFPALIGWGDTPHPSGRLVDRGVRLRRIEVVHPEPGALARALARVIVDDRVHVVEGRAPGLRFVLSTPRGDCVLA